MDIVIGRTTYINKDSARENAPQYYGPGKKKKAERRKNKRDRRKSVRDGVIVTLSCKNDRRAHKDRRKKKSC
jgi:hypothetical protein